MKGTLFALHHWKKKKLQKKTKHVINTNAQFVTFNNNNNNKIYPTLIFGYLNFPWKATSVY